MALIPHIAETGHVAAELAGVLPATYLVGMVARCMWQLRSPRRLLGHRLPRRRAGVPAADFQALMASFPSGVAIVTATGSDGKPYGMTCSSLCSVALTPPTLLVCMRNGSPTLDAVLARAAFTVNLLHDRARSVADLFASGKPDRFDQIAWRYDDSAGGPHLIEHAHAIADCDVAGTALFGDHVVVFGEVARVSRRPDDDPAPLLYGLRQYSSWASTPAEGSAANAVRTTEWANSWPARTRREHDSVR